MLKKVIRLITFLQLILFCSFANGQEKDTISIRIDQLLLLKDTIYNGIVDSVIVLEKGTDYQIIKNILVRKPAYYVKHPKRKETLRTLHSKYGKVLIGNIQNKKELLPEDFNPADSYYRFYENRIINAINIENVAVLEGNVFDTTKVNKSTFGRFLNKTYHPSREHVIRNNLKFHENDRVDPRILSDNERLLRNLTYIEDAWIQIVPVANSTDSVNVNVVLKDRYPIGVRFNLKDYNAFALEPYTRNFMGLGHNLGIIGEFDGSTDEKLGYGAYYGINNISGTFINSEVRYLNGIDREFFTVGFQKPFLTANTKFGGEIIYQNINEKTSDHMYRPDSIPQDKEFYKLNLLDLWAGYSLILSDNLSKPFLNFASRFYSENYKERPDIEIDDYYQFHDKKIWLASVSLQKVKYIKTSKLLQFGIIEDVPIGYNVNLTGGWERNSFYNRPYYGMRFNYSIHFQNAGIFSAFSEMGSYRYESDWEDALAGLRLNYVSSLKPLGKLEIRNILELKYSMVKNPKYLLPYFASRSFTRKYLVESDRYSNFVLNYQPVFYSDYQIGGFRFSFNPYLTQGWLKKSEIYEKTVEWYNEVGFWINIKNESLIFPAMHLQFGFFPDKVEDEPRFVFKIVFKDLKMFKDFTSLKPLTVHPSRFN